MWVLESRLYTILKRGIPQCYELPSITTFPVVLYPIFDCFLKWSDVSPVVSFPPSFARTFSSKERRLGTRQLSDDVGADVEVLLRTLGTVDEEYNEVALAGPPNDRNVYECLHQVVT